MLMVFVPVPHHREEPPSPQAMELTRKITALIEEYRRYYPSLSEREVRQAVRDAVGGERRPGRPAGPAIAAALAAFALGLGVFLNRGGATGAEGWSVLPVITAVAIAAILALVIRRRR